MMRCIVRSVARSVAVSLCVFLSFAVCGVASAGDIVDLESETAQRWLGDRYYGVFRGEARVGWLRRSLLRDLENCDQRSQYPQYNRDGAIPGLAARAWLPVCRSFCESLFLKAVVGFRTRNDE